MLKMSIASMVYGPNFVLKAGSPRSWVGPAHFCQEQLLCFRMDAAPKWSPHPKDPARRPRLRKNDARNLLGLPEVRELLVRRLGSKVQHSKVLGKMWQAWIQPSLMTGVEQALLNCRFGADPPSFPRRGTLSHGSPMLSDTSVT